MICSHIPLVLFMLHPCGEQYNCLSLLTSDGRNFTPKLLINFHGSSIRLRDRIISPFAELYKKNKADLMNQIACELDIRLWKEPVRDYPSVRFLKEILEFDSVTVTFGMV